MPKGQKGWARVHGCAGASKAGRRTNHASSEYYCWAGAIGRCYNINNPKYPDYGGRGITMCERWRTSFANFLADVGPRPKGLSLDRFPNNDGNYEPGNVRWATPKEQSANRRTKRLENFSDVDFYSELFRRTPEYGMTGC